MLSDWVVCPGWHFVAYDSLSSSIMRIRSSAGTLHVLLRHSLVRVPLVHLLHEPARPAGSQRQTGAPGWGPNEGRSFTGAEQSQALSGVQGRASNAGCLVPTEVCELPHADDRDPRILPRPRPFLLRVVAPVDQVELPVVQLRYLRTRHPPVSVR